MSDFLIKIENYSEKDKLYLVGLMFLLGYQGKYTNVPISYEAIKNYKYIFFDALDSEIYGITGSSIDEIPVHDPRRRFISILVTWEEYPKDEYKPVEEWTPKYEVYTLAQLEEKCNFLSIYSKEQIMYIGSRVSSITMKANVNYTTKYRKPYNPYKLVGRNYNFHYHTGEGEDAE